VLLCELAFVPFFSVVYLVLFFHNAWKPFLIEILGIGMSVTGVVLALG
jgi:hypothetical protein